MRTRCFRCLVGAGALMLGVLGLLGGARSAAASGAALWSADAGCAEVAALPGEEIDFAAIVEMQEGAAAAGGGKECTVNSKCAKKEYCAKAPGECKGKGACKEKPEICTDLYLPVCGCDGKTYSNDCWAAAAGVNVKSQGPCKAAVCKTNAQCPAGDFCAKGTGKCDDSGTCARRPRFCPLIVDPVCGCDGKTYNNRCEAFRAGVNVIHNGKCEK